MSSGKVHWEGKQWRVTDHGLESLPVHYVINAERLGETNQYDDENFADWPFHVAEKTWLDYQDFLRAFFIALDVHAGKYDPLSNTALGEGLARGLKRHAELLTRKQTNAA